LQQLSVQQHKAKAQIVAATLAAAGLISASIVFSFASPLPAAVLLAVSLAAAVRALR